MGSREFAPVTVVVEPLKATEVILSVMTSKDKVSNPTELGPPVSRKYQNGSGGCNDMECGRYVISSL